MFFDIFSTKHSHNNEKYEVAQYHTTLCPFRQQTSFLCDCNEKMLNV